MKQLIDIAINYLDVRKKEYKFLYGRFLTGRKRILDAGCGIGNFISFDPRHIEGVDQNIQSLKIERQRGYKVKKLLYRYDYLYYPMVEPSRFPYLQQKIPRYAFKITSLFLYRIGVKNYF